MKKIINIVSWSLGIAVGLFSIIGGFGQWFTYYWGSYTSYETYGGDAYTGIQNATADVADNINSLGYMLREALSWFFVFFGAVLVIVFVNKLLNEFDFKKKAPAIASNGMPMAPAAPYAPAVPYAPVAPASPYAPVAPAAPYTPVNPTVPPMV